MKLFIMHLLLCSISASALALGDNSGLPTPTRNMKDTVSTLNQVTPEEEKEHLGQQDMQERMYQEQEAREKKDWEEQKRHSDYTSEEQSSE